jgi:hypothetical protein
MIRFRDKIRDKLVRRLSLFGRFIQRTQNTALRRAETIGAKVERGPAEGLPRALFGAAAGLRERLKEELGWIVDVQPVVVLVGSFPQTRTAVGRLGYVGVRELVAWLKEQPLRVAPQDVVAIREIVARLPAAGDIPRA